MNQMSETGMQDAVEKLRAEKYPGIPSEMVKALIEAESSLMEDRASAWKAVCSIVEEYVAEQEGDDNA
jgi:hypothetical protein